MKLILKREQYNYLEKVILEKDNEFKSKFKIQEIGEKIKLEFDEDTENTLKFLFHSRLCLYGFSFSIYIDDDPMTEEGLMLESLMDALSDQNKR